MVKGDLVAAGKFDEIEKLTREAVQSMLGFELAHVGINANSDDEAGNTASVIERCSDSHPKKETLHTLQELV